MSGQRNVDVDITRNGDIRDVTVDGIKWRIRVSLRPDGVRLEDADSGELYFEQSLDGLGISYRGGRYSPKKSVREMILNALVIGWVALLQHNRH